ncbi:MAG: crossover junction endodeoxyribonuclease RuvC [Acidobacteriaceae bacterium]
MRVLGIDCGTQLTGYGVVETDAAGGLHAVTSGAIRLNKQDPMPHRLGQVYARLTAMMVQYQPGVVAIEEVFHAVNSRTALLLGQVRGVALLAADTCKLEIAEYAPLAVKSAVTGYGLADKKQVQFMVMRLLELVLPPEPLDASDALAIAICHIHHAQTTVAQCRKPGRGKDTK